MKHLFLILTIAVPLITFAQKQEVLSSILWSRVSKCHAMFEEMNSDFNKVDDSKNGYLEISGEFATCGCSCHSTVGAYKNSEDAYVILQSDEFVCAWEKSISSNLALKEILPIDFGIKSFTLKPIKHEFKHPIFFLNFEIPRIGTDTKVTIELIPFGLNPEGKALACFNYAELEGHSNSKSLYEIEKIARRIESDKTLDYIISGNFNEISNHDSKIINEAIGKGSDKFDSKTELQNYFLELKAIFDTYQSLDFLQITLGWNRQESKFYVKAKKENTLSITFRKFLKENKYWSPVC